MERRQQETAGLLAALAAGDRSAFDRLFEHVHAELELIADRAIRREPSGQTVQVGDLLNDLYLKLVPQQAATFADRRHFLGVAATAMRRLLVDRARRRLHSPQRIPLSECITAGIEPAARFDILDLDEALDELAAAGPRRARQARLVDLIFFGGLARDEAAAVVGVSPRTADTDWTLGRAWLRRRLSR